MTRTPAPKILTVEEAAHAARTPIKSLRCWIADGRLKHSKPGKRVLIRRADLAALLAVPESDLEVAS